MKSLLKYLPFYRAGYQSFLAYKFEVLIWVFGDFVFLLITYFLWNAIYQSSPNDVINGFNFQEMVIYIFIARIVTDMIHVELLWIIGDDIKTGSIAMQLIKPISYRTRLFAQSFGQMGAFVSIIAGPILIIGTILLHYALNIPYPSFLGVILFIVTVILAYFILLYLDFILGMVAFKTLATFGIGNLKGAIINFLSGALIPLSFFPLWAQDIFHFLPFSSVIYTPTMILMGKYNIDMAINAIIIQIIWVIILMLCANFVWKKVEKRLVVQGG